MAKYNYNLVKMKILAVPLMGIVIILCLAAVTFVQFYTRFQDVQTKSQKLKFESNILKTKLDSLKQIAGDVLVQSEAAYQALPSESPAALVVAQLKKLALENNISIPILNVNGSSIESQELQIVSIDFEIEGEARAVISFLTTLETLAPLMNLESVKIVTPSLTRATGTLTSYWSSLPLELPSLTDGQTELTEEERLNLEKLANLKKAEFIVGESSESGVINRTNPFDVE